jgi:hypothetical protein
LPTPVYVFAEYIRVLQSFPNFHCIASDN